MKRTKRIGKLFYANFVMSELVEDIKTATTEYIQSEEAARMQEYAIRVVDMAYRSSAYSNYTGRLRASVGAVIMLNGTQYMRYGFKRDHSTRQGVKDKRLQGTLQGLGYARSLALRNGGQNSLRLAIVAGAPYADIVEKKTSGGVLQDALSAFSLNSFNRQHRSIDLINLARAKGRQSLLKKKMYSK